MSPFRGLSVCRSGSYIVLKRQKISIHFLLHTTASCFSQIVLKFGLHHSYRILPLKWPNPLWFERRRHSMANCGEMVKDTAMVTQLTMDQWKAYANKICWYFLPYLLDGSTRCKVGPFWVKGGRRGSAMVLFEITMVVSWLQVESATFIMMYYRV